MVTTTLPEIVREQETAIRHIPQQLVKELEELVEHAVAEPELVHWYHFVPCAGVRFYTYQTAPSPVEPLVTRKG